MLLLLLVASDVINSRVWIPLNFIVTCNKLICCKTGLNVVGKTRNIAIQLVLQKQCKIRCTVRLPVLY